jgi:hypothetical protein
MLARAEAFVPATASHLRIAHQRRPGKRTRLDLLADDLSR